MLLENLLLKSESVFTVHVNVRLGQLSSSVWLFVLQCDGVPQEPLYWCAGIFVWNIVLLLSWNISCGWGQCVSCALCVCVFTVSTQVHIPPIYSWQHWEQSVLRERVSIYTLLPRTLLNSSPVRHADTFCTLLKDDVCDFCATSGIKRNCNLFVLANISTMAQSVMWVKVWLIIKYKTRGVVKGSHFFNSFWCWINYTIHLWTNSSPTIKII